MDDFESPEVQKDFPGLHTPGPSKSKKEEAEFAPDKNKKKDKKDKDKGYAALACNESSPDEDDTTKSPSKSKRIKAFKFPLKKEKREKSRDKDQVPSCSAKKEKKERKLKSSAGPEMPQDLGDAQPIFGVPLAVAVERGRCHDMENPLPLVVRDCIDYLQEHGNDGIYKTTDTAKETKVQNLKKLYNNRESNGLHDLDTATAASLLKLYLRELPEPIFTTELLSQFEEASAIPEVQEQERLLRELVGQLPTPNQTLLKWVALHLDSVSEHEGTNASSLSMLLSPVLQTSQRLFVTILCHCRSLFILPSTESALPRYIPPLSGPNPVLPETRDGILQELSKQESLLSQIHSEMNSGFVTKRIEEQLWEVQRIITQLKRKLRQVDKVDTQKSIEDTVDSQVTSNDPVEVSSQSTSNSAGVATITATTSPTAATEQATTFTITETGLLKLPTDHPEANNFTQLQLENYELQRWRDKLQTAINQEKAEIIALQKHMKEQPPNLIPEKPSDDNTAELQQLLAQNAFLESTRKLLCDEIMSEHKRILDLRVQLSSVTVAI